MPDIGIVGLDTSHAEAFAGAIDEHPSARLAAVWDGGDVRDAAYERTFCEEYGARSYEEPFGMTDAVDAVMILTVDWDSHRSLAVPFLECDVPTLIDKPIAGRVADVEAIRNVANGTALFGGSAVPYHPDIRTLSDAGIDGSLYCVGYDDPFYYGAHLVDTICLLVDAGWACVTPADDPGLTADVVFEDGTLATLRLDGSGDDDRFAFLGIGDRAAGVDIGGTRTEMEQMYRSYLETFLAVVDGEVDVTRRLLDAAELGVALQAALRRDRPITPGCAVLADYHVDAQPFLDDYRPYY